MEINQYFKMWYFDIVHSLLYFLENKTQEYIYVIDALNSKAVYFLDLSTVDFN
jgi:hypothetical protein